MLYIAKLSVILLVALLFVNQAGAEQGFASWYSIESTKKEGTWDKWGGRTASGEIFNDENLTCASWDYDFGTKLKITNIANGKSVIAEVTDRGPAKRLYRQGRTLDLSKAAFRAICDLKKGLVRVKYEST